MGKFVKNPENNEVLRCLTVLVFHLLCDITQGLKSCNESFTSLELCKLTKEYLKEQPTATPGEPIIIDPIITLSSVSEFEGNLETLTLDVIIKVMWNDSRLTMKSEIENE